MGGHGGLNIIPQKSWNPYGRENRLRVARDEEKHAAEAAVKEAKHRQAEGERRREQLLARARQRQGLPEPSEPASAPDSLAYPTPLPDASAAPAPAAAGRAAAAGSQPALEERGSRAAAAVVVAQEGKEERQPSGWVVAARQEAEASQHINFFHDLEERAQHPEVLAAKRAERRQRGSELTQTSDPKFDAKFQLGHRMGGAADQPWYAQGARTLLEARGGEGEDGPSVVEAPLALPSPGAPRQQRSSSRHSAPEEGGDKASRKKQKKHKRDRDKAGDKRELKAQKEELKARKKQKKALARQAAVLEGLMRERIEREAAERQRAQEVLRQGPGEGLGRPQHGKRYHAAYGLRTAAAERPRRPDSVPAQ